MKKTGYNSAHGGVSELRLKPSEFVNGCSMESKYVADSSTEIDSSVGDQTASEMLIMGDDIVWMMSTGLELLDPEDIRAMIPTLGYTESQGGYMRGEPHIYSRCPLNAMQKILVTGCQTLISNASGRTG